MAKLGYRQQKGGAVTDSTLPPPPPVHLQVFVIDANRPFAQLIASVIEQERYSQRFRLIGWDTNIPSNGFALDLIDVVIFTPDDFRNDEQTVRLLRARFGSLVQLIAQTDRWDGGREQLKLAQVGVTFGFQRNRFDRLIKILSNLNPLLL